MGAWSRSITTNEVWWSRELEELFSTRRIGELGGGENAPYHEGGREQLLDGTYAFGNEEPLALACASPPEVAG